MKIYHIWGWKTVLDKDTYCKVDEKTLSIVRDYKTVVNSFIVKVKIYLKSKITQLQYHYLINSDVIILRNQK